MNINQPPVNFIRQQPLIQERLASYNLWCRKCEVTIEEGEKILVFIYDHNPVGTGPAEHLYHKRGL